MRLWGSGSAERVEHVTFEAKIDNLTSEFKEVAKKAGLVVDKGDRVIFDWDISYYNVVDGLQFVRAMLTDPGLINVTVSEANGMSLLIEDVLVELRQTQKALEKRKDLW